MQYFLVDHYEKCLAALQRGFQTVGVQFNGEEYEGNWWWTYADWVEQLQSVEHVQWTLQNRMIAEDFIMDIVLPPRRMKILSTSAMSLFHIPHNLYDCPTPMALYNRWGPRYPSDHPKGRQTRPGHGWASSHLPLDMRRVNITETLGRYYSAAPAMPYATFDSNGCIRSRGRIGP